MTSDGPSPAGSVTSNEVFLRAVPIFAGLDPQSLRALATKASTVQVPAGDLVFRAGDPGDALYVLRSGRVEVVDHDGAVIRALVRGAVLGELAILTGSDRSASARARRDTDLLRVGRDDFLELLEQVPGFTIELTKAIGAQLQASRGVPIAARPQPAVITVVGLTPDAGSAAFADRLVAQLGLHGRVARVPRRAGEVPAAGHASVLDAAERENDQVVLVAGELGDGDWPAFCLRQADRVLALADLRATPPRGAEAAGWDLVVHDGGTREQLAGWVRFLDARAVHHVNEDEDDGIARLARRLAGLSLGLVLSGGGARGLAHIGVLEELGAAGVVVDRIAGSSMGAFVGGQYALGRAPSEILERCRRELVEGNPLGDYTLPIVALSRGRRGWAMVRRTFGDTRIEELERDFFCVSCDMLDAELVVHRRGPMYEAVACSVNLPGIAPPVALDGRLLIDGGVFNNLPVEQMAAGGEGPILAVDVTARFRAPGRERARFRRARANRAIAALHRLVTGVEGPRPRLRETIIRSIALGSIDTAEAASRFATWTIEPDVEAFGMLAFDQIDSIREAGRHAARELLARTPLPGAKGSR